MKKLLIVIDYQNDFVNGSLGFEKAKKIENNIAEKIKEYRNNNDEIIFTFDTHNENYLNTLEGKNLPVPHCIINTEGHKLYGKIADLKSDIDKCFYKCTYGSDELFEYLKNRDYISVEICGVVTNICVIANAVLAKTALFETPIYIDCKCVASNDDDLNLAAIKVMESLHIKINNKDFAEVKS